MRARHALDDHRVERAELRARRRASDREVAPAGSPAGRAGGVACRAARRVRRSRAPAASTSALASPSTSTASGPTTASFSRAMSATVGPSQRVCSRPTLVSTTTGARSTSGRVVAPAQARLDDRDLDRAPRELVERGGGEQPRTGSRGRPPRAPGRPSPPPRRRAGRRRRTPSGSRSASPIRMRSAKRRQVRREVRAGAHAVGLEQRGGHAHRRALAVRADDVDRAEALLRGAERRQQPAHALEAEAHAEELEAEQVLLRAASGAPGRAHSPARSSRRPASLSRSASTTAAGALPTKPCVAELVAPRGRSPRPASPRRSSIRRAAAPRSSASVASTAIDAARHRHGRRGLAALAASTRSAPAARRAPPCARSPRLRAAPAGQRAGSGADPVAPAAQRLHGGDRARDLRLGLRIDQRLVGGRPGVRHQQSLGTRDMRPDLLGDERDHRMRDRERLGEHAEREARDVPVVVVVEARLDDLQVPVAQLAVDEVVEPERGAVELERLDRAAPSRPSRAAGARGSRSPRPSAARPARRSSSAPSGSAQQHEPRGVEQLVRQLAALGDLLGGEAHVLRRGHRQQPEARPVGAVLVDQRRAGRCRCRATSTSGGRRGARIVEWL